MLMGIMGHVGEYDTARSIVSRLLEAMPPGSYLALYDSTNTNAGVVQAQERYNESGTMPYYVRGPEQIAGFFDGLELVEPGLVACPLWRPDEGQMRPTGEVPTLAAVGRKP